MVHNHFLGQAYADMGQIKFIGIAPIDIRLPVNDLSCLDLGSNDQRFSLHRIRYGCCHKNGENHEG